MKREDVKKVFPNATNEQITAFLNQYNAEIISEREKAESDLDKVRADAGAFRVDAVNRLAEKLAEMKEVTSKSRTQQEIDAATGRIEELEQQIIEMKAELDKAKTLKSLADNGITGENAEKLYNSDGSFNFDTLGKILAEKEAAAAMRKEQRIASHSTNPTSGGSCLDDIGSHVPYDAEAGRRMKFGGNKDAMEIREYYESKMRY